MSGTAKVIKGRIKEATGTLTGNDSLRRRGQADQVIGHSQQKAEAGVKKAKEAAKEAVDKAEESGRRGIARAEDRG